jgi:hypothetical protein
VQEGWPSARGGAERGSKEAKAVTFDALVGGDATQPHVKVTMYQRACLPTGDSVTHTERQRQRSKDNTWAAMGFSHAMSEAKVWHVMRYLYFVKVECAVDGGKFPDVAVQARPLRLGLSNLWRCEVILGSPGVRDRGVQNVPDFMVVRDVSIPHAGMQHTPRFGANYAVDLDAVDGQVVPTREIDNSRGKVSRFFMIANRASGRSCLIFGRVSMAGQEVNVLR